MLTLREKLKKMDVLEREVAPKEIGAIASLLKSKCFAQRRIPTKIGL